MKKLWHLFTHWLMSDMYTLEERALMAAQAERLQLKTELLHKRRQRVERIGYWQIDNLTSNGRDVFVIYDLMSNRKMTNGCVFSSDTGREFIAKVNDMQGVIMSHPAYLNYIRPWLDGRIGLTELAKAKGVKIS